MSACVYVYSVCRVYVVCVVCVRMWCVCVFVRCVCVCVYVIKYYLF